MKIIAPSILSANFLNLEKEIKSFDKAKKLWLHLDVMDYHFVPNLTFGKTVLKNLHTITKHKLDAHFMVENIDNYIEDFKDIGIYNFTYHYEAVTNQIETISKIKKHYKSVGISIKPSTQVEVLTPEILKEIDLVLIMSVEPGFGGQSFMENSLDKVNKLEKIKDQYSFQIQIDGGINEQTSKLAIEAGVDNLVAGSYIFKANADEYLTKVNSLRD